MVNTPIVVNLLGGAGSGKSTTAAAIFSLLKLHGIETELITEFAKDLVWEERFCTAKNQHYVFSKQQHRLWRVGDKVDVMVTDSPALLRLVYGQELSSDTFKQFVLEEFNAYNNINFFLNRPKTYNEVGRNENEKEAKQIDKEIIKVLDEHGIDYFVINSDFTAPNKITERILHLFNKELKFKLIDI
jgi:ABC-type transporter Mla maintaining outer membrane lipid asymmetry ATPase subunit MlaF